MAPSLPSRAPMPTLRGMTLAPLDEAAAEREYTAAVDLFEQMHNDPALVRQPAFVQRFGDLLLNLAVFSRDADDIGRARQLLARAVGVYADVATKIAASGSQADAQNMFDNLSRVIPVVPEPERERLRTASEQLRKLGAVEAGR